jgi:hypothetical protein
MRYGRGTKNEAKNPEIPEKMPIMPEEKFDSEDKQ